MLRPEPRHENMAALFISIIGLILYVCKTRRESLATCNCGWEFALGLTCHGLWGLLLPEGGSAALSSSLSEAQHGEGSGDSSLCKISEAST